MAARILPVVSHPTLIFAPAPAETAILRTLVYADIFDFPLTPAEIHHYLIAERASLDAVRAALTSSAWLAARVTRLDGCFAVGDRAEVGLLREARQRHSATLWFLARRWAARIGCLPFVRMVAVTGALAMDNSSAGDDIDFLVVAAPGRVWLARALTIALVRVARLGGVGLCPNYVLSQSALAQDRHDLYVAHDLAQMVPLVGHAVYAEMRAANEWVVEFLPHARHPLHSEPELAPRNWLRALQRLGERLLSGPLGDALEAWERRRKLRKFSSAAQKPGSAAQLDADHVKGHFDDHGHFVLAEYEKRAARYFR